MNIERKILLSRLLTRSGDQAWDFAVPIALLDRFPDQMRPAFFYFFVVKFATVVLMPFVGRILDRRSRDFCLSLGIFSQGFGVILTTLSFFLFPLSDLAGSGFLILLVGGIIAALGSNLMDIAVANDLVPSLVAAERLSFFNGRLRQLDLLTEVLSPVIAGGILYISTNYGQTTGLGLIGAWNLISFFPEYILLRQILKADEELLRKATVTSLSKLSLMQKLSAGWKDFIRLPISSSIIAYAFLWLSILSPHGVLLTAFLKGGWQIPEPIIGIFRGGGAVFGLVATLLWPRFRKSTPLLKTTRNFLLFQSSMVILSLLFFVEGSKFSQGGFLFTVLLSRIGLYGFSLGEVELRQRLIPEHMRGEINGVASALNSLATLIIFGLGLIFSTPQTFQYLVLFSVLAVVVAAIIFSLKSAPSISQLKINDSSA